MWLSKQGNTTMRTSRIIFPMLAVTAWGGLCFWAGLSIAREPAVKAEVLLSTGKTIIGQPISYPTQTPAKVTAAIITMPAGAKTGWHIHEVPLFAHILEGELKVDYGPHGERVYKKGDTFMEAVNEPHDGASIGSRAAKVLAVFIGAEGLKNSLKTPAPASR
jgi:quercetin dioxygenase-like cupin family protein